MKMTARLLERPRQIKADKYSDSPVRRVLLMACDNDGLHWGRGPTSFRFDQKNCCRLVHISQHADWYAIKKMGEFCWTEPCFWSRFEKTGRNWWLPQSSSLVDFITWIPRYSQELVCSRGIWFRQVKFTIWHRQWSVRSMLCSVQTFDWAIRITSHFIIVEKPRV